MLTTGRTAAPTTGTTPGVPATTARTTTATTTATAAAAAGRRFRDRRRGRDRQPTGQGGGQGAVDTEVREGDVLLPVAGIVDILDNYAFVRTTGYLSGPTDVYVSLSMVRKYGLRRGDAITGAVREQREGEQSRQKFNPLVRVDAINGQDPETSRKRPEFTKLTPLYPNERLRLETEPHKLTTRVIDLVMPIGKGQRALIVSPPKAGKTTIMQNIANAITTNNPECHLMVVLVDERPEEVTDMQRSVKGEVIASTFDRPPTDHTTIAELSIERAKRLVEMGHDVVVLLDNITRLGRAYNLAAPASGRILSGGVDSTALYPPKRFLGAARNIEDGGSLTILATALVETGSTMDTVIFEEFKGTGNAELKLDRRIADKRVFPAIDVGDSGTRKEELLMSPDEYAVMVKLRRLLSALDDQQAIDLLLTQLRKTRTNIEFLMQVAKSTPGAISTDGAAAPGRTRRGVRRRRVRRSQPPAAPDAPTPPSRRRPRRRACAARGGGRHRVRPRQRARRRGRCAQQDHRRPRHRAETDGGARARRHPVRRRQPEEYAAYDASWGGSRTSRCPSSATTSTRPRRQGLLRVLR